jgi:AbrB family looped-hinge helix DNA binding protein
MEREITIDASGRLVVPREIRERHHLDAGSRLTVIDRDDGIVLVPQHREPTLVERAGLLVVAGPGPAEIPDHRSLREQDLARFKVSARPTRE